MTDPKHTEPRVEVMQADREAANTILKAAGVFSTSVFGTLVQAFARHRTAAEDAEIARLTEELRKAQQPQWFYLGEECDSDSCRFSIDEVISEDFEYHNKPEGDHVLMISGGRPVPDMWVAVHYYTEAEKDARESDDEYDYTVHATEEEARAALTASEGGEA